MAARGADNLKGAAISVGTLGAFACNDGLIKLVMETVPELHAVALRAWPVCSSCRCSY